MTVLVIITIFYVEPKVALKNRVTLEKKMKKTKKLNEVTELAGLVEDLSNQINQLRKQITQMPSAMKYKISSENIIDNSIEYKYPTVSTVTSEQSKIIQFPRKNSYFRSRTMKDYSQRKQIFYTAPIQAPPGRPLRLDIPDCRSILQRDGLILLSWDKRNTEKGEQYTAYWVTSMGIPRFYASKPMLYNDLQSARPDHKSYAAEDGIEFYGQRAPVYIVHVAPELMKSNPKHKELRAAHIKMLNNMGSKVNFNYKYLLKTEKNKKALPINNAIANQNFTNQNQAG